MTRICLDTSAYSNFQRGQSGAVDVIDTADWIGMPSTTLGELWSGFLRGARTKSNVSQLQDFLAHSAVEIVSVDDDVARIYGEIITDLHRSGKPLPTNDIWIAATAARAGAAVLTFDAHFRAIARVGSIVLEAEQNASGPA